MGWASGSAAMNDIIGKMLDAFPDDEDIRKKIYDILIETFEELDCDTLHECLGEDEAFDFVYRDLYPGDEEESDLDSEEIWNEFDLYDDGQ